MQFTASAQFLSELDRLIKLKVDNLKTDLALNTFSDLGQVQLIQGQIRAFKDLEDLMTEAQENVEKLNR